MASNTKSKPGRWWKLLLLLAALGLAAAGGYRWWQHKHEPDMNHEPDMTAVIQANVRGIGFMDKFEYQEAVVQFEKVVALAPKWIPGRINLAIALLNIATPESAARATSLYREVLKEEPNNPYAHHGQGVVLKWTKDIDLARGHFQEVTRIDPLDPDAWYELGSTLDPVDPEAKKCLEKALELEPYLSGAIYGLAQILNRDDETAGKALLDKHKRLVDQANWGRITETVYAGLGKYTICIGTPERNRLPRAFGPLPLFEKTKDWKIELPAGVRWAKGEDFGPGTVGDLYRAIRKRFGLTMIVLDYDRDGKLDIFLAGAVVDNGKVRDLLLHNEGGKFCDVTRELGLADQPPSLGVFAADYDNDDYADLLLTGVQGVRLFRNAVKEGKGFIDVTKQAKLDSLTGVCLGAGWLDLDQDADLDLIVCQFAENPEGALAALSGKEAKDRSGVAVFLNIGEAKPDIKGEALGLTTAFKRWDDPQPWSNLRHRPVNVTVADIDADRDVDFVVITDGSGPLPMLNDRLLKFHLEHCRDECLPGGNGMLILDSRQRDVADFLLISPREAPQLWLNSTDPTKRPFRMRLERGLVKSPNLIQAKAVDFDLDGNTDIIGLSEKREPVLLHNDGEKLLLAPNALGVDWPADIQAVTAADLDGDDFADLLVWSESQGLQFHRNLGNGNKGLKLEIKGRRFQMGKGKRQLRCNNDGIGVKVRVYAGGFETGIELGTLAAGLGQSHENVILGLGKNAMADVVRLRWPDGTWQGELSLTAGQLHKIAQINRMPDSCPLLFTWDGEKYAFICDFLGGGALGEPNPDGTCRQPRPEESVWIRGDKLKPKDGKLRLKIGEPMDEATYLDRLQLITVDHPKNITVYPEERFASAFPSQDVHALGDKIFPDKATDHRGRDVLETSKEWDRKMIDGFATRSWLGFAEEHWVELDFGDRLAKFGRTDRLFLCLAGWTDYPYPEAIIAAGQAGVPLIDPVLERKKDDGKWETIVPEVGFPAGRPRMMLVDVTGKLTGPTSVIRLRTNMQVYWDQIFVAPALESLPGKTVAETGSIRGKHIRTTTLPVESADLRAGNHMQEYSPDGKAPTLYDFHKHEAAPISRLKGMMTRFGEVTELLSEHDDRFVVFAAGDELTVSFDAAGLSTLPDGWTRSYILRSWGYCKSISVHTATGETIEPLPFRAMSQFPYGASERYPQTPRHQEYLRKYQTRKVGN
ncbi:MAG: VCBS repeat-containing protein [Planctomycetes bacterium]|nr:VCBS repeat-containing protein [Planctomycetota bacterium]